MKKGIAGILLLVLFLGTGCQPTPDAPVVIQKDLEQMLETAGAGQETAQGTSLRERYDIPERLEYTEQGANGKLQIRVNAEISVPETDALPIVRVTARDFTQEESSRYFRALCGGMELYAQQTQQTKAQIEEAILNYKELLANPALLQDKLYTEEDRGMLEEVVAQLEQAYRTAPETAAAPALADGTIGRVERWSEGRLMRSYPGIEAYSRDYTQSFLLSNDGGPGQAARGAGDRGIPMQGAQLRFANNAGGMASEFVRVLPAGQAGQEVPEEAAGRLAITPAEAVALAAELLAGTDMVVTGIFLMENREEQARVGAQPAYAYMLLCGRSIGGMILPGLSGAALPGMKAGTGPGVTPTPGVPQAASWQYEQLELLVGDEGITGFTWNAPHELRETIQADTQIQPFASIADSFKKMSILTHVDEAAHESVAAVELDITEISLELMRILEQDCIAFGLLVPVWNFYGVQTVRYVDAGIPDTVDAFSRVQMCINAIDGSIIDLELGY